MKINPRINKQVSNAIGECYKVLANAIAEMLKQIGAESDQKVSLNKTVFMFQSFNNTTNTIIANHVVYCDRRSEVPYIFLYMGDDCVASDATLTLSSLEIIYNEVRRIVRSK